MIDDANALELFRFADPVQSVTLQVARDAPMVSGEEGYLPLEDRVLLVAAYWRTNLTPRQLALLFGSSKSAADRIIDQVVIDVGTRLIVVKAKASASADSFLR